MKSSVMKNPVQTNKAPKFVKITTIINDALLRMRYNASYVYGNFM